ncbi:unnamed protein product, partial [Closterium sp. Yama58-4]
LFLVPWLPEWLLRRNNPCHLHLSPLPPPSCAALQRVYRNEPLHPLPPALVQSHVEAFSTSGALTAGISYHRAFLRGLWRFGRPVPVPHRVLVLWAGKDKYARPHMAEPPPALVPNTQVVHFPDLTYWMMWDDPNQHRSGAAEMRVKRQREVRRHVRFYRTSCGFREPFKAVADGTFLHHVMRLRLSPLATSLPKLLGFPTRVYITRCILAELQRLGDAFKDTRFAARQLEVARCTHEGDGAVTAFSASNSSWRLLRILKNQLVAAPGGNQLVAAPGGNQLVAAPGGNQLVAAPGGNQLVAAPGGNQLVAAPGGNQLVAAPGGNQLVAAPGGNQLVAAPGGNQLVAAPGGNQLVAAPGGNQLVAAPGGNQLVAAPGGNQLVAAPGGNHHHFLPLTPLPLPLLGPLSRCTHEGDGAVTASECIQHLVAGGNHQHFFVASQDIELKKLLKKFRSF